MLVHHASNADVWSHRADVHVVHVIHVIHTARTRRQYDMRALAVRSRVVAPTTTRTRARATTRRARTTTRASEETKSDPFGFGTRRTDEKIEIIPGFDTAEGGKVGPLGTLAISSLLILLFGGSLFFTTVPRGMVEDMAARELADDPNAPTNRRG